MVEVDFSEEIDSLYDLTVTFAQYQWEKLLELGNEYYPDLVLQFYANILYKHRVDNKIETRVNGQTVVIDEVVLRDFLGCDAGGMVVTQEMKDGKPCILCEPQWDRE